jgi:hypothetical protein
MNPPLPVGSSDEIESRSWWPEAQALAEAELAEALKHDRQRGGPWPPSWDRLRAVARALGLVRSRAV